VYIADLQLNISPYTALYTELVPDSALTVNEDVSQGRRAIILDFNDSDGLLARDLGTIFEWPTMAGTVLDVWQPSIIPLDDDVYQRMSFHCLMKSLGGTGWQHAREMNIAYQSVTPLTLLLTFDQWPSITLTVPSSNGSEIKQKVILPPNKWKLMEIFLSSTQPFKLWGSDLQLKIRSWGSTGPYRIAKPVSD
jgi:hypothetical protein